MRHIPRSIFRQAEAAQIILVRSTFNPEAAQKAAKQVSSKSVSAAR